MGTMSYGKPPQSQGPEHVPTAAERATTSHGARGTQPRDALRSTPPALLFLVPVTTAVYFVFLALWWALARPYTSQQTVTPSGDASIQKCAVGTENTHGPSPAVGTQRTKHGP